MATQPIETMTALKCQSCNAPLTVSPDDVVIVCGYCGFTSTIEGEKVANHFVLEPTVDAGEVREVVDEEGRWAGVRVRGFEPLLADTLLLEIPVKTYLIGIPERSNVRYEITEVTSYEIDRYKSAGLTERLGTALDEIPRGPAEVTLTGHLNRQRVAGLRIAPLVYDEATGALIFHERFRLRVISWFFYQIWMGKCQYT